MIAVQVCYEAVPTVIDCAALIFDPSDMSFSLSKARALGSSSSSFFFSLRAAPSAAFSFRRTSYTQLAF